MRSFEYSFCHYLLDCSLFFSFFFVSKKTRVVYTEDQRRIKKKTFVNPSHFNPRNMLLKKKYNFSYLIKQKRFLPLDSSVFYHHPASVFNLEGAKDQKNKKHSLGKKENLYPSKSRGLKESTLKTLNKVLNINKYSFFENHQRFRYKQIHTYFREIISDQKKRAAFAKGELKKTILKTLLSVNQKTFVFTRRILFNSVEIKTFKPVPPVFQEVVLKDVLHLSSQRTQTSAHLVSNTFEQGTFWIYQESSSWYAKLGPVLFLEKTINPLFTEKTRSFSRIRNRCLLSGQSSIVGKYRLNRTCFRHYVNCGLIPGLTKNKN